ncbi:uncharacterized protein J3R85_013746 [Psidium guajava]|nr:uncharacterized protein J3R85_013746 [Psidium guajava]
MLHPSRQPTFVSTLRHFPRSGCYKRRSEGELRGGERERERTRTGRNQERARKVWIHQASRSIDAPNQRSVRIPGLTSFNRRLFPRQVVISNGAVEF